MSTRMASRHGSLPQRDAFKRLERGGRAVQRVVRRAERRAVREVTGQLGVFRTGLGDKAFDGQFRVVAAKFVVTAARVPSASAIRALDTGAGVGGQCRDRGEDGDESVGLGGVHDGSRTVVVDWLLDGAQMQE